ncbi:thrombopoietin receptor isoform X2 [Echeneis naucrates]|nr:thrombopoietin receptor isoform X2 [Echeneis naucrates]
MYVTMYLEVKEHNTNNSLYNKTINVEDNYLLEPPYNVSLHRNGQAGQLQVSWKDNVKLYCGDVKNQIRYSAEGEKTKETTSATLDSLGPGKEVEVQVNIKCERSQNAGHWSSWSQPVRAMVPQSADDVSLMCYTSDLQNIACRWNGSRLDQQYTLSYKIGLSPEWRECRPDWRYADLCHFNYNKSSKVRVKVSSSPAPLSRTFYSEEFTLNKIVKTSPPANLKGTLKKDKLCLQWEAPPPFLSAHLQYEVGYQNKEGEAWMVISLDGPEAGTCLDVSTGNQYHIKVRAKPNGLIYSGHWSNWSDILTGHNPVEPRMLFMLCLPVFLLIPAILIYTYLSKIKQYFWPPVPNLEKVLQGFLTEINRQKWDPPLTTKVCPEETTASVVEIMSEEEVSEVGKSSKESSHQLLLQERTPSSGEQVDCVPETNGFPDYVTLNKDTVVLCPKGQKYMLEKVGEKGVEGVGDELLQKCQCSCSDGSVCVPDCLGSTFLNHSYMSPSEATDRFDYRVTAATGAGHLYTNLPCS